MSSTLVECGFEQCLVDPWVFRLRVADNVVAMIVFHVETSGKPRLTHVANSVSGNHAAGLGRVEVVNKNGGQQKETLA